MGPQRLFLPCRLSPHPAAPGYHHPPLVLPPGLQAPLHHQAPKLYAVSSLHHLLRSRSGSAPCVEGADDAASTSMQQALQGGQGGSGDPLPPGSAGLLGTEGTKHSAGTPGSVGAGRAGLQEPARQLVSNSHPLLLPNHRHPPTIKTFSLWPRLLLRGSGSEDPRRLCSSVITSTTFNAEAQKVKRIQHSPSPSHPPTTETLARRLSHQHIAGGPALPFTPPSKAVDCGEEEGWQKVMKLVASCRLSSASSPASAPTPQASLHYNAPLVPQQNKRQVLHLPCS